jgi:hypothetical protein
MSRGAGGARTLAQPGMRAKPGRLPLVATLLARAALHGAFAIWLSRDHSWFDVFRTGSSFGLADGALGLLAAVLLGRRRPVGAPAPQVAIVATDGALRLAAAVAIRAFPGLPDIPLMIVLFFAALGVWAAVAGGVAVVGDALELIHRAAPTPGGARVHALFHPLSAAGLVALGLAAYAFVMGPPTTAAELRMAGACASGALALVFVVTAIRSTRL